MKKTPDSALKCKQCVTQFLIWETYISLRYKDKCYLKHAFLMVHGSPKCSLDKSIAFRRCTAVIQKYITQYNFSL